MPSLGLCNPVLVAYWSHAPTLLTHDHFGPQGEGTGAIEAALLLIVTVRLFPPSPAPVVLCSALLY
jgi:hypothetical protein